MAKSTRRVGRGTCCVAAACLVSGAVLATLLIRPEPGLLDHATRLADAATWAPQYGGYFWQDNARILSFRPVGKGVRAVSVETRRGTEVVLPVLSEAMGNTNPAIVTRWRLSPDGSNLIWGSGNPWTWSLTDIQTGSTQTWPDSAGPGWQPLWMPDGKSWLSFKLAHNDQITVQQVPVGSKLPATAQLPVQGASQWLLGVSSRRTVVFSTGLSRKHGRPVFTWTECAIEPRPHIVARGDVPVPEPTVGVIEAELSPDGRRIALLTWSEQLSSFDRFLWTCFHRASKPHKRVSLWLIYTDGRSKRLLGSEERSEPFGVLWRPDGKVISLVDHGLLYSITAPP